MANFENGFYEEHAVKVDGRSLSDKFHVDYTPEGSTPDGYHVPESLTIETGRGAVSVLPNGAAVYQSGGNETDMSVVEPYTMIGIDTNSKEFKQFQKDIQNPENYNAQTVEKMLETVPQLTAEKQVETLNNFSYESEMEMEQFKNNFVNSEVVNNLATQIENKGFTKEQIRELAEDTWDNQTGLSDNELEQVFVEKANEQLIEKGYEPVDYQSLKDKENNLGQDNWIGSEYVEQLADKGFTKERLSEINAEIASANFMADDKEIERQLVDEINQELTANGHDEILLKGSMAEAYRESSANNPEISNKTLNEIQKQAELKGVDDNFAYDTDKAEKHFAEAIKQIDTGIEKSTEKVNSKINELQSSLGVDYATAEKIENIRDQQNVKGGAEIAQPGRTYTGNVVSVDEDKTIQVTKTGKLVIHETENLPGIKEQDTGGHLQIRYSAEGKGDITAKSNDMEIGKQKEVEKHHQVGGMER